MSPLKEWLQTDAVSSRFRARGCGEAAESRAALMARSAGCLVAQGVPRNRPVNAFFVPGRVEILGKHTDYAGGRSLVAAAEQGFCQVARPRADRQVRIWDAASSSTP